MDQPRNSRNARLQQPRAADEGVRRRILYGLSCRDYRIGAEAVPDAFGLSNKAGLSRKIGPHALRHYAATSILKQMGDLG